MKLRIGEIYRLSNDHTLDNLEMINGVKNFICYTKCENFCSTFRFERGIHKSQKIKATDGDRDPVIIISSSPHKAGSENTPWKDRYDPDNGTVIYYGDCKDNKHLAHETSGNKILMDEWKRQGSSDESERIKATPIVFFERTQKGYLKFHGVGVLEKVSLITQKGKYSEFTNFEFEFGVLDLSNENNELDWNWINDRFNKDISLKDSSKNSPDSWKYWLKYGNDKIEKVRRHVLKSKIIKESDQNPPKRSIEEKILKHIKKHYEHKKLQLNYFR